MECQPRLNEKCLAVLHCISNFEKVLLWKVIIYSYLLFYCLLFWISFYISRLFRTLFNIIKKCFCQKSFFFNGFTQTPNPLKDINKVFWHGLLKSNSLRNTFLIIVVYIYIYISFEFLIQQYILSLKGVCKFVILYRGIFSRCPLIWGSISKTIDIFGIFWVLPVVYLFICKVTMAKVNFCFYSVVKLQHILFANEPLLHKMLLVIVLWLWYAFIYTLKKIMWKNYVRFWKWNLKLLPIQPKICFQKSQI